MKLTQPFIRGRFLSRPNRFLAIIQLEESKEQVQAHVPNTSRLTELTIHGAPVLLSHHKDLKRKTAYSLRMIEKQGKWFSIDSHLPNDLVECALKNGVIEGFQNLSSIEREKTYKRSRFDFKLGLHKGKTVFLEVKGVTLEDKGVGYFPGAPTKRGVKHLQDLLEAVKDGHLAEMIFVLQFNGAHAFRPNWPLDPSFSQELFQAHSQGVAVSAYGCYVSDQEIFIQKRIPVFLEKHTLL